MMVVVAIVGILAALSASAFAGYLRRSKVGEASQNINGMFRMASSYYTQERTGQGTTATTVGNCTVVDVVLTPADPGQEKVKWPNPGPVGFEAIGFKAGGYIYFGYAMDSGPGDKCNNSASSPNLYTMKAHGDLDDDDINSTFELAVGSDTENQLMHARGFHVRKEIE
jgi:type II secretory pathway pseudopilin PulG